jgi:aminoglycoside 6'-N-acetyltransferase I
MNQLLKSDGVVFVAQDDQAKLVGFAGVSLRHDHVDGASISPVPYVEGWFVEASFRKQGADPLGVSMRHEQAKRKH